LLRALPGWIEYEREMNERIARQEARDERLKHLWESGA
jgi:hypothetical protein